MDTKSESNFLTKLEHKYWVRELMPSLKPLRQSGFSFRQIAMVLNQTIEAGKPKFEPVALAGCYQDRIEEIVEEDAMRFFKRYERARAVAAQFGHVMPPIFSDSEIEEAGYWPMTLIACVTLDGDDLRADLSDDRVLRARDPRELARLLLEAGVWVDNVSCADWREGDIAPLAGQVVALKMAMREGRGRA